MDVDYETGNRSLVSGPWSLVYGLEVVFGIWYLVYGIWYIVYGNWYIHWPQGSEAGRFQLGVLGVQSLNAFNKLRLVYQDPQTRNLPRLGDCGGLKLN